LQGKNFLKQKKAPGRFVRFRGRSWNSGFDGKKITADYKYKYKKKKNILVDKLLLHFFLLSPLLRRKSNKLLLLLLLTIPKKEEKGKGTKRKKKKEKSPQEKFSLLFNSLPDRIRLSQRYVSVIKCCYAVKRNHHVFLWRR